MAITTPDICWYKNKSWADLTAIALTCVLLVVLPIPHTIALRLTTLFLATTIVASRATRHEWSLLPLKWPLLIWLVVQLLSLTTAVSWPYSLNAIKSQTWYGFLVYILFFFQCREEKIARLFIVVPLVVLALLALGGLAEWISLASAVAPTSIYDGVGAFTTYGVSVFPLLVIVALSEKSGWYSKATLAALFLLLLVTVYLGGNRMFWLAFAVEIIMFSSLLPYRHASYRKKWLYGTAAACLFLAAALIFYNILQLRTGTEADGFEEVITTTIVNDPRWPLWQFCVAKIYEHPLWGAGFGLGSFARAYPQWPLRNPLLWHAHNVLLNYGIEMGLPGIIAFLWLMWKIIKRSWTVYRTSPLYQARLVAVSAIALVFGVLAKNMTDDFFYQDLALLFWAIVGGILGYFSGLPKTTVPADSGS